MLLRNEDRKVLYRWMYDLLDELHEVGEITEEGFYRLASIVQSITVFGYSEDMDYLKQVSRHINCREDIVLDWVNRTTIKKLIEKNQSSDDN